MSLCCGQMGMSVADFNEVTLRDIWARHRGWTELERYREREAWRRDRFFAALLLQPHSKKRIAPEQLVRLDDEVTERVVLSEAQQQHLYDVLDALDEMSEVKWEKAF